MTSEESCLRPVLVEASKQFLSFPMSLQACWLRCNGLPSKTYILISLTIAFSVVFDENVVRLIGLYDLAVYFLQIIDKCYQSYSHSFGTYPIARLPLIILNKKVSAFCSPFAGMPFIYTYNNVCIYIYPYATCQFWGFRLFSENVLLKTIHTTAKMLMKTKINLTTNCLQCESVPQD